MSTQSLIRALLLVWTVLSIGCGASHQEMRSAASDPPTPTLSHTPPPETENNSDNNKTHPPPQERANTSPPPAIPPFRLHSQTVVQASNLQLQQPKSPASNDPYAIPPLSDQDQQHINNIVARTNAFRQKHNLRPLAYDATLSAYAQVRAREIITRYEHVRPNGEAIDSSTDGWGWWGENLYASPKTAQEAMAGWIKSNRHRINILKKEYDRIGVGYVYDPNTKYKHYWTQIFASSARKSRYYFASAPAPIKKPHMTTYLRTVIQFDDNNRLSLRGGETVNNRAAAAFAAETLNHPIFKAARRYHHNGFSAIIQEPTDSGFSYQTFGEIVDRDHKPVQYVNLGKITVPDDNYHFSASYRGVSFGNLNQKQDVYAEVSGEVEFAAEKTLQISWENSQTTPRDKDSSASAPPILTPAPELNFSKILPWNSAQGRFSSDNIHAYFYGPHGEEIGGQFQRHMQQDDYSGVFVLKKQ